MILEKAGKSVGGHMIDEAEKCRYWPIEDRTTPSGRRLFQCEECGHETDVPTKKRCGICSVCQCHYGEIGHARLCEGVDIFE